KDSIKVRENSPLPKHMVNNYANTKWMAECMLRESSLPYVILRPRALVGRGDTVIMPRLIRSRLEGKLKIMGSGNNMVDLTPVSNMVEAVRLSIFTPNCNEAYNISNGEPVNLWESINSILTAIGLPAIKNKIPYPILYLAALIMEFNARFLNGKEPVLTRYSVGVLAKTFTFEIQKAKEKLNYKPIQTTAQAMEEFVKWYKEKES
ncbi:NAD-dependent epimerase/dehydratase family protein, partial [Marivirga sp.]|uniref:NAD-dependent epimerase/dehydratase family protein n=1 Tax=Marivirga sp. TaxID=2018662 RepID=UPI0025F4860C